MASSAYTKSIFPSSTLTFSSSETTLKSSNLSFTNSNTFGVTIPNNNNNNTSNNKNNLNLSQTTSYNTKSSLLVKSVLKTIDPTKTSTPISNSNEIVGHLEKPTILVSEKLGNAGVQVLQKFGHVECAYDLSPEDLCSKISNCDALIVRSGTKVTRKVFEAAKGRLKVVGRAGVGIDNVDLQAATEFGCLVVNAPTANTIAAAEHGIALLAAMARNVPQADASIKQGTSNLNLKLLS